MQPLPDLDLAENEFCQGRFEACCAVAPLIGEHASHEPRSQHLLSLVASAGGTTRVQLADYHLALAKAHHMPGQNETAASHYRAALAVSSNLPEAHLGLAALRMPGDDYLAGQGGAYLNGFC